MGKPVARLLLAVVTIAVILLPFTDIQVASSELDTEKTVFAAKYAVVEGPLNQVFTVYNVKPHFVAGNLSLLTPYSLDVWWEGKGLQQHICRESSSSR